MKRWKGENRETAPWIDPMTPNLSPLTFCLLPLFAPSALFAAGSKSAARSDLKLKL